MWWSASELAENELTKVHLVRSCVPHLQKERRSKAAFMVRKERIDYLNQGNRLAPGALNYSAGDRRFLLLTRQRRDFGVTSHIPCKTKILATDGLLINYFNFFHPNEERAYGVAMHWRQHEFSPWFRCLLYKQSSKENSDCIRDFLFQRPFWCLQGSISPAFSPWSKSAVCNRGQRNWVSEIVLIAL